MPVWFYNTSNSHYLITATSFTVYEDLKQLPQKDSQKECNTSLFQKDENIFILQHPDVLLKYINSLTLFVITFMHHCP
jgi:hypothetical protein